MMAVTVETFKCIFNLPAKVVAIMSCGEKTVVIHPPSFKIKEMMRLSEEVIL